MSDSGFSSEFSELASVVDTWVCEEVALDHGFGSLREVCCYPLSSPGKRFRPVLALLSAKLLGVPQDAVRPFALAIELTHTFSLVHDDLPSMDNDDLRRGLPTTHKQFGEAAALLAGDALLGRAFGLLAKTSIPSHAGLSGLLALVSSAVVSLCDGQMLDLQSFGSQAETQVALERRHLLKTAALIRAAVVGPTYFLPETAAQQARGPLESYGTALGLLFQITDDILDAGQDLGQGNEHQSPSYVSVLGADRARQVASKTAKEAQDALEPFGENANVLRQLVTFILSRTS